MPDLNFSYLLSPDNYSPKSLPARHDIHIRKNGRHFFLYCSPDYDRMRISVDGKNCHFNGVPANSDAIGASRVLHIPQFSPETERLKFTTYLAAKNSHNIFLMKKHRNLGLKTAVSAKFALYCLYGLLVAQIFHILSLKVYRMLNICLQTHCLGITFKINYNNGLRPIAARRSTSFANMAR